MAAQAGCLFCVPPDEPCPVHQDKPSKKAAPRKQRTPTTTPVTTAVPVDNFVAAPKASRFENQEAKRESQEDLMWREAIRALYPIMCKDDRWKYRELINPPQGAALSNQRTRVRRILDGSDQGLQGRVQEGDGATGAGQE